MDAAALSTSGTLAFLASNSNEVTWRAVVVHLCRMPLPQALGTCMKALVGLKLPAHSRSSMDNLGESGLFSFAIPAQVSQANAQAATSWPGSDPVCPPS